MYSLVLRPNRILLFALALPAFGGSVQGIKNFHQVDQHVYRGAQPSDEGFASLAQMGVKTIIDLREPDERSQNEQSVVTAAGMKYVNVPMTGLTPPSGSEIAKILGLLKDGSTGPVFYKKESEVLVQTTDTYSIGINSFLRLNLRSGLGRL